MLSGISLLGSKQASDIAEYAAVIALFVVAVRVTTLRPVRTHLPFLGMIGVWLLLNALPFVVDQSSTFYAKVYMISLPITWIFYLIAGRKLYNEVFSKYRGIAFAGTASLTVAVAVGIVLFVASIFHLEVPILNSHFLTGVFIIDLCVVCGLSFLLGILVIVIWYYPIDIASNIAVHCMLFSAVLFTTALANVADQLTNFRYPTLVNTLDLGVTAVLCLVWAARLNPHPSEKVVRFRLNIDPAMESRLLHNLESFNVALLRAARR